MGGELRARSKSTFLNSSWSLSTALRQTWHESYGRRSFLGDLSAGAVVGVVAIPLSMALAIATGLPPQHGLYTAIVAGALCAVLGGSRVQVTGPTAAFIVVLAPIVEQYGLGGLMLATGMAGTILFAMGLTRMGRLIEYVPYPVTAGFTAGIAVVIATLQMKDLLGLHIDEMPEAFAQKVLVLAEAIPTARPADCVAGAVALALLILLPRRFPRLPAPLIVLPLIAVLAWLATQWGPDWSPISINDRFSYTVGEVTHQGIPQIPPPFSFPWDSPDASGNRLPMSWELLRALMGPAFAIAVLAAIESLLSAVIADGLTGKKHDPDGELMALGIANVATTFFGGFAATGAIARTATNVRFGAVSPVAAVVHSAVVLVAIMAAAPLLGYLPMAALAALLLVVAWNMSEARHVLYVARIAPHSDVFVLAACFSLTVLFDMAIAVMAGLMLASLLFIRRMSEVSSVTLLESGDASHVEGLAHGVIVYEIAGPLFFGAAEKAMSSLRIVGQEVHAVIFDFRKIPAMDVTGLINLNSAIQKLTRRNVQVVLAGVHGQPAQVLAKAGLTSQEAIRVEGDFNAALQAFRA